MNMSVLRIKFDIATAIELWQTDLPVSEMASRLGTTKSSLIGFAYRNRSMFPVKCQFEAMRRRPGYTPPKPRGVKGERSPKVDKPAKVASTAYDDPEPLLKTFREMDSNECKWPIDRDRAETRFCCHQTEQGQSYCGFHQRLSRGNGTHSERSAHRMSKRNAE